MVMTEYSDESLPFTHELTLNPYERFKKRALERVPSRTARYLGAGALALLPFLGAATAVGYAPAKTIDVAGAPIKVSPEFGQDYSSLHLTKDPDSNEILVQNHKDFVRPIAVSATIDQENITYGFLEEVSDDITPLTDRIKSSAQSYTIELMLKGGGGVLAAEVGALALFLYGGERVRRTTASAAALAGIAVCITGGGTLLHNDHQAIEGNSLFEGTRMEGVEVHVQPDVIDYLAKQMTHSYDAELYTRSAEETRAMLLSIPELQDEGWATFILVDDIQGNKGAAQVVGTAANTVKATIATSGDTTDLASHTEAAYTLDTLKHYADENDTDTPIVMTAGPHDTRYIVNYAKNLGFIIPDGETTMINGVSILGFNDPRVSNISLIRDGESLRNPDQSVEDFPEYITEVTCEQQPDIVIAHDYKLMDKVNDSGCADISIGGRTLESTSISTSDSLQEAIIRLGSGGGHTTTKIFPKKVEGAAQFVVLQVNPETKESRYLIVTTQKDGVPTHTPMTPLTSPQEVVTAQQASHDKRVARAQELGVGR